MWYLDIGCSNHMMGDKDIFIDIDPSFDSKVRLENEEYVEVKDKRSI